MAKAGVRYTRIPDPAHVLSARVWARGEERKTDNHQKGGPIKDVYSRTFFFNLVANTVGPKEKKISIKGSFHRNEIKEMVKRKFLTKAVKECKIK
jgi:hypothetical protein